MLQIQITQIANGFLVSTPPEMSPLIIQQMQQSGQQPAPKTVWCEDFEEVTRYMRGLWPKGVISN